MKRLTLFFSTLALFFAGACASDDIKSSENPEVIYNQAAEYVKKERFLEAGELIQEIRTRFPQSRFAALAELKQADIYFAQDLFTEAAAAYGVFVELYPNHTEAAYALFYRSTSYFNDAPELVARDQAPANDAIISADLLVKRYPKSEYVEKAKELIQKARFKLAEKEAYVAQFYERKEAPKSALKRWEGLKATFSDIKSLNEGQKLLELADQRIAKLSKEADPKN
jgi:outer membrane protein assembly factor BamD